MSETRRRWLDYATAWLRGIAQLAFLDAPLQGGLLLTAIALLSPWSAIGTALGAAVAIVFGPHFFDQDEREWAAGLGAYDSALVGLAWAGVLARGGGPSLLFILALLACLALRAPLRRWAARLALPLLGLPALLTVWISLGVFVVLGADFWSFAITPAPAMVDLAAAALAIFAALWLKHPRAALLSALLGTGIAALMAAGGKDAFSIHAAGLWAFTVIPAVFAYPATLLPACRLAWRASAVAAVGGALIWLLWSELGLLAAVPPLMAPLFLGIWLAALLVLGRERGLFLDPELQHAAQLLARARDEGGAIALTGAGISTASGIPDYTAGAWLAPGAPLAHYGYDAFLASHESRRLYWDACAYFRHVAAPAVPNPGHHALAALEERGCLTTVITQNVDGLHQKAGSDKLVELHGNIAKLGCLWCGSLSAWPEDAPWHEQDMLCPACGGWLKPAVVAFGEGIPPGAWWQAQQAASGCKVLLVVGSQLAVSSASALVAMARANGANCIFITLGWLACPVFPGDRLLVYPAERVLPVLARYLDAKLAGTPS